MVVHHGMHKQSCVQQESVHLGVGGLLHVAWLSCKLSQNCIYTAQGDLGHINRPLKVMQCGGVNIQSLPEIQAHLTLHLIDLLEAHTCLIIMQKSHIYSVSKEYSMKADVGRGGNNQASRKSM